MSTDNALARLRVTSKCNGDIGLGTGGAQKFPKVEFTHLSERWISRSLSVASDIYERDHPLSGGVMENGQ
jgi:hypothetical protein